VLEGAEPPRLKERREQAVSLVGSDVLSLMDDEGVLTLSWLLSRRFLDSFLLRDE
jgi:hypothetical protein